MTTRFLGLRAKPLFYPRLLEILGQCYRRSDLLADLMAGITIGLIALPLALAPWNRQHPRRHADALPSASGGIIYAI